MCGPFVLMLVCYVSSLESFVGLLEYWDIGVNIGIKVLLEDGDNRILKYINNILHSVM